jgi:hypothetical protein
MISALEELYAEHYQAERPTMLNLKASRSHCWKKQWFNNPDSYDLAETERVDEAPQAAVIRSSRRFDIVDYIKLDGPKHIALVNNVDVAGPDAAITTAVASKFKSSSRQGAW